MFAGQLPPEDVSRELSRADFVIFASRAESLSYSLLEAIRLEKPIACSSSSALPEVLGQHGVDFDAANPVSIANACRGLVAEFGETKSVREDSLPETASSRGARIWSEFFTGILNFFAQHGPTRGPH